MRLSVTILAVGVLACLAACSTTRNLPEGEKLYTGIERIEVLPDDTNRFYREVVADELEAALAYPPNNAILGSSFHRFPFPVGLWIYNGWVNRQKGIGNWIFKNFASDPVLVSEVNPQVRSKVASNLLREYGFFQGKVWADTISQRNPRKQKVTYHVRPGRVYMVDSVEYLAFPNVTDSLIRHSWNERLLRVGEPFNLLQLEAERNRLATLFRNNGFYYFRPDYLTYQADTVHAPGKVWLRLSPQAGLPKRITKRWYIGNTEVVMQRDANIGLEDSLQIRSLKVRYQGKKPPLRPGVLFHNLRFRQGDLYSLETQRLSQENMARMGIFSSLDFRFTPRDTTALCDTLDLQVSLTLDKPYDVELEMNATTKSNDQVGPGLTVGFSKKNAFRGGETFSVKLNGSYEWQTGKSVSGNAASINSYELGLTTSLTYPRLMFPGWNTRRFRFPATTEFKLYAEQLNRAGFFRLLSFGGSAVYGLQTSPVSHHTLKPFSLSFDLLQSHTAKFDSIMERNPALGAGFRDQFIPAMSYAYTFDDASVTTRKHHTWWRTAVTSSGNVTSAIYAAFGHPFDEKDKSFLGNPFAQFLKLTTELRNVFRLGTRTRLATRLMGGIIYAYGNSSYAPYSEQFFIGGANSLRAFTARTVGPGSYHPEKETSYSYLDETGDIKLEANVELRFPLLGNLHGALFLDAGNVWLLRPLEGRPGGAFRLKNLLDELALGTGLGVRYDLEFIVLRLDLGIALHAPYDTGKKGYYNIPDFWDGLGLHFAVGYPF